MAGRGRPRFIAVLDWLTGQGTNVGDADNSAVRVNVVAGGTGPEPGTWDFVEVTSYTTDDQPLEVEYRLGGSGGTLVATANMTYDGGASGGNLLTVTWT